MILRTRILALAGLLAALFLSLIVYTLVFFTTTSAELNRIVQRNLAVEQTTESLNSTVLLIRSEIWDTMVFDLAHRAQQVQNLDARAKDFYRGLRELAAADPSLASTAADLRLGFQEYYQFGSTILELESLDAFVGQRLVIQKFRENQAGLLDRLSAALAVSKQQFFGAMQTLNEHFAATTNTAFVLAGLVTVLSFLIAWLMARRLARPLERLTRTVRQVSAGNYRVRPTLTSSGEIRDLTETFITMLDQIEDYSGRMEDLVRARTDALVRTNSIMVRELKLAQKIQGALIPQRFPASGPLAAAGAYLPMEDLGGDFYDVFEGAPGVWTLVMADVSGHGVPAALVTAMVKISLGLRGPQTGDPGQALAEVNRELCAAIGDLKRYVTMVLCHLDLNAGTLAYCNAGHNELVLLRRSGLEELCGPNSGVVGLRPDELFLTRTLPFHPGDSLVLFTDGLVEARNRAKEEFGLPRLLRLVREESGEGPQGLVEKLSAEVVSFAAGQPQQDDIAFLAVRWDQGAHDPIKTSPVEAPGTPQSTDVVLARTEDFYRTKEFDSLLGCTEKALANGPDSKAASRLWHWRAMALQQLGRSPEALDAWDQALQADGDHHRARRNRSLLAQHLGEVRP